MSSRAEGSRLASVAKPLAGALVLLVIVAGSLGAWLSERRQYSDVATAIFNVDIARAPALVRRFGCAGCHAVPGVAGADGKVGPPLDHLRERVFIGGVVRNSPDNLVRWIVAPQSLSPHSAMPPTGVSADEAKIIAAYLYAQ